MKAKRGIVLADEALSASGMTTICENGGKGRIPLYNAPKNVLETLGQNDTAIFMKNEAGYVAIFCCSFSHLSKA